MTENIKGRVLLRATIAAIATLLPLILQREQVQGFLSKVFTSFAEGWVWWLVGCGAAVALFFDSFLALFKRVGFQTRPKLVSILSIIVAAFVTLFAQQSVYVSFLALFWITGAFFILLYPEETVHQGPSDLLHRRYLAKRIVDYLLTNTTAESIRRIGIVGPWGSGKTRVLELIRYDLEARKNEQKFKLIAVNVWTANTPEDVWQVFSESFDVALGFKSDRKGEGLNRSIFEKILKNSPSFFPGVSQDVVNVLTSTTDGRDKGLAHLEAAFKYLVNNKIRIVFLVDDIERASPEVIKAVFPVLDRLSSFKSCNFIIAIDPERVAKAFGAGADAQNEAEGALAKVLDLQIALDVPTSRDMKRMAESLFDKGMYPKLAQTLDSIAQFLPSNPRLLARFIDLSKSKEFMWLDRYGDKEMDYSSFFLLRLLESEFEGIGRALLRRSEMLKDVAVAYGFDSERERTVNEKRTVLLSRLIEDMSLDGNRHQRLDELLGGFIKMSNSSILGILNNGRDLDWMLNGHSKLLQLSPNEVKAAKLVFLKHSGEMSMSRILSIACPQKDFEALEVCSIQVLKSIVEGISEDLRVCFYDQNLDRVRFLPQFLGAVDAMAKHFAWCKEFEKTDLQAYEDDFFAAMMTLYGGRHSILLFDDIFKPVQEKLSALHISVVDNLPFAQVRNVDRNILIFQGYGGRFEEGVDERVLGHLNVIADSFESRKFTVVFNALQKDNGAKEFHKYWSHEEYVRFFLSNPEEWLGEPDRARNRLNELVKAAHANQTISNNIQYIVHRCFFQPFLVNAMDAMQMRMEVNELAVSHGWYVRELWKVAILNRGEYDLFEMRARVLQKIQSAAASKPEKREPELMHLELFESTFPLSHGS